ncbi:hypothetical protein ETN89_20990 (plasmid) [Photobacterium damselae subsp. damselae]|uniref:hypothetical protein n=1 Tax=Photobacterium damselae TaxID=38293 RepID=UPI000A2FE61F|nr:hypothetical protein [Photobacterium damselae]ARR51740.1 hypothetical protein CAY62_20205 [Photobacterium damselae subsp. damselae]QAY37695.1 hypothetical protein ETN89_20990 [Photobacterium damselae subsp. damselae]
MPHNISLNNTAPITASIEQGGSDIFLQTTVSTLPRVSTPANIIESAFPQALSVSDSCIENEESSSIQQLDVKKNQAEKRKKVSKKSNKYSNHSKAKGHLAAIAGATTLGAVLAPFTGGLSLLPTAFIVLFGNATALAMYGGSEFVLGQQGASNKEEDKKDIDENKQPEGLAPLSPKPITAYGFRGFDEIDGRLTPEDNKPEEKGSGGKENIYNYSPVFNINFGDLNITQFNSQDNTQFNTPNNTTDGVNQKTSNSQSSRLEQTIELFGEHPVIDVVEITKEALIDELHKQDLVIGSDHKVDEMIDALVSFHEQAHEAKLIQVRFEGGHKAYIGGIPETEELHDAESVKANTVVDKVAIKWPEVAAPQRVITSAGNAKIDSNPGYTNSRVEVNGQTVGYSRSERVGVPSQQAGTVNTSGAPLQETSGRVPSDRTSGPSSVASQTSTEPQTVPTAATVDGNAQTESGSPSQQTGTVNTANADAMTEAVTGEPAQIAPEKKWPEVAAPQRVITSAGNAKIDSNPGYTNSRVEVNGQTVGYSRSERVGVPSQQAGTVNTSGAPLQETSGRVPSDRTSGPSSVASQTSTEPQTVPTAATVDGNAQTESGSPSQQTGTVNTANADTMTEAVTGEPAQIAPEKKWPEVAAPQRVITSAGNAKIDSNPGYTNSRVEVNGQTVGYSRSERVGVPSQQAGTVNTSGAPLQETSGRVPSDRTSGPSSVASQTSTEPQTVPTAATVDGNAQTESGSPSQQTGTVNTANADAMTEAVTGEPAQIAPAKKWPEVAAPQRVITSAGNAKIDSNPGYTNSRVEVNGQTVGYSRSERVGVPSQQAGTVNTSGAPLQETSGRVPSDRTSGPSSVASQTSTEPQTVPTAATVDGNAQTESGSPSQQTGTVNTANADTMTEAVTGEPAQIAPAKKWPEVAAPQRVITSAGNAKIDSNPGYTNSRVEVNGQTVGYSRSERVGVPSQQAGTVNTSGAPLQETSGRVPSDRTSGPSSVASQTSTEPQTVPIAATVDGNAQTESGSPSQQTGTVNTANADAMTEAVTGEPAQIAPAKKWPEVAAPQRVITSAGNAKIDSNPGYTNSRVEVNGQTVGYSRSERVGVPSQQAGTVNTSGAPLQETSGRVPSDRTSGPSSVASQTSTEPQTVPTAATVDGNAQTESGSPSQQTGTVNTANADTMTEAVTGEPAQIAPAKKWPEVAAPQRVITSAGNAKIDSNPGYTNSRVEVNGQTVGYSRSERVGVPSQQAGTVNTSGAPLQETSGRVPSDRTSGPSSVASQTSTEPQTVPTAATVDGNAQTESGSPSQQTGTVNTANADTMTEAVTGEPAQIAPAKKWPEVAAPQRVITSAGNAKIDSNPGYTNSRVEVNGQTVGYSRSERVGVPSQQAGTVNTSGAPLQETSGRVPSDKTSGPSSVASQTSTEPQTVPTAATVDGNAQTESGSPSQQTGTVNTANADAMTEAVTGEPAQIAPAKKWPEVAAPQRVITSAGNAKIDSNPGYTNSRVEVNGQTVGYSRSERVGVPSQQAGTVNTSGAPLQETSGRVPSDRTSGPSSVASQTSTEPQTVPTAATVDGNAQTESGSPSQQTGTVNTANADAMTEAVTGEPAQIAPEKKWPEVAAPQRVITSAGNAKIDSNPGYTNSRVEVNGQTVGYSRSERVGVPSQQAGTVNTSGAPLQETSGRVPSDRTSEPSSVASQTSTEPQTVPTAATVDGNAQTESGSPSQQTGTLNRVHGELSQQPHNEVEQSSIKDITKLIDITALTSASNVSKSEPERFVSKFHITLKGQPSADGSQIKTHEQFETPQLGASYSTSHATNVKHTQNDTDVKAKVVTLAETKAPLVVSNITGKKWIINMPIPVLTTQGMVSGRAKNYTQGLFNNIRDVNLIKKQLEASFPLMDSVQRTEVPFLMMGDRVLLVKPAELSNLKQAS